MGVSILTGCFHFQLTKEIQRDQKGGDSLLDDYMLSGKYSRTSLGTRFAMWTHLLGMTIRACVKVFESMVFIPDEESSISTKPSRFQQFQVYILL